MRSLTVVVTSLLLVACSKSDPASIGDAAGAIAAGWVEHDGGAYTAWFPTQPMVKEVPLPTLLGLRTLRSATSVDGDVAFMISAVDLQVPEGRPFASSEAIASARAPLEMAFGGEVQSERDITVEGLEGKELWLEAIGKGPDGGDVQAVARHLADDTGGKRLFTLMMAGRKPLDAQVVARFFDAFAPRSPAAAAADPGAGALPPSCKAYVDDYLACVAELPEAVRGPAKDGLQQMLDAWSKVRDVGAIVTACAQAVEQAKGTMASACPDVRWD